MTCHAAETGYQVFVMDTITEIPGVLEAIAHTPDEKGGDAK